MDIEDAFTQDAIAAADTNVGGEEEDALREVITRIMQMQGVESSNPRATADLCVLCWVAGRTYQSDQVPGVAVTMGPELIGEFLNFLVQRSTE